MMTTTQLYNNVMKFKNNAINSYNLIVNFSSDKDIMEKFLNNENLNYCQMSKLHIKFAVTVRNDNGRLKNKKIVPCFIINTSKNNFIAYPIDYDHAKKLYSFNNSSIIDNNFDTRYGTNSFWMNPETNEFHFDSLEPSTSNTIFFSILEEAKDYLNAYVSWFHSKKKEDENRRKNGIITISEIAEKFGIPVDQLKIVDENEVDYEYFDGACRDRYGELPDGDYIY